MSLRKSGTPGNTYKNFRKYMDIIFTYSGTLSLNKELKKKKLNDIKAGDVFIKGGSPGHAVIVIDTAVNPNTGDKVFLLAQSFMPAQQVHILKNNTNRKLSPWYSVKEINHILDTPEYRFTSDQLKEF